MKALDSVPSVKNTFILKFYQMDNSATVNHDFFITVHGQTYHALQSHQQQDRSRQLPTHPSQLHIY